MSSQLCGVELADVELKDEELGGGGKRFRLSFSDVNINVKLPDGTEKVIMDGVSGHASTGHVMALMGPTGSGKTTLLSALANRLDPSVTMSDSSKISYGGKKWYRPLKRRVGFVEQDDVTYPELTVRQALTFAARLRLSDKEAREPRVNELLAQMRLEKVADTLIGGGLQRGVSGGERKRVCIATELISKPMLLFCDEPSSGLDSETALVIIGVLRELSLDKQNPCCVVCSIHQPSSQVYSLFDDLCFLDSGRCVYFGPAGQNAIDYFVGLAKVPCPANYNPPDWFMEQAVHGKFEGVKFAVKIGDDFHADRELESQDPGYAVSLSEQVGVIFERSWLKIKKEQLQWPFYMQQRSKTRQKISDQGKILSQVVHL